MREKPPLLVSCVLCHSNYNSVLVTSQNALQAIGEIAFPLPFRSLLVGKVWVGSSAIVVKKRGKRVVFCSILEFLFQVIWRWWSKPQCVLGRSQVESFLHSDAVTVTCLWPKPLDAASHSPWFTPEPSVVHSHVAHLLAPILFNSRVSWKTPSACELPGPAFVSRLWSPHIQLWVFLLCGFRTVFLHYV